MLIQELSPSTLIGYTPQQKLLISPPTQKATNQVRDSLGREFASTNYVELWKTTNKALNNIVSTKINGRKILIETIETKAIALREKILEKEIGAKIQISGNISLENREKIIGELESKLIQLKDLNPEIIIIAHGKTNENGVWEMNGIPSANLNAIGRKFAGNKEGKVLVVACESANRKNIHRVFKNGYLEGKEIIFENDEERLINSVELRTSAAIQELEKNQPMSNKVLRTYTADQMAFFIMILDGNFNELDLSGCDLSKCNFRQAYFKKTNLSGAILPVNSEWIQELEGKGLFGTNLSGCDLSTYNLEGVNLDEANLSKAILPSILKGVRLQRADLTNAQLPLTLIQVDLKGANLSGQNLTNCNFQDVNLQVVNFSDATLPLDSEWIQGLQGKSLGGANLSAQNLSLYNLQGVSLARAKLGNAILPVNSKWIQNLQNKSLEGADLSGQNLSEYNLSNVCLKEANLSNAVLPVNSEWVQNLQNKSLEKANLSGQNLSECNLEGVNLRFANLSQTILPVNLKEANLEGANLSEYDLSSWNLEGANLEKVNLSDAILPIGSEWIQKLKGQSLKGVNLSGQDLSKYNFEGVDLQETNLTNVRLSTNLKGSNLKGVNLSGYDLSEHDLTGANLSRANLLNAKLPSKEKLVGANFQETDLRLIQNPEMLDLNFSDMDLEKEDFRSFSKRPLTLNEFDRALSNEGTLSSLIHNSDFYSQIPDSVNLLLKLFKASRSPAQIKQTIPEGLKAILSCLNKSENSHLLSELLAQTRDVDPKTRNNALAILHNASSEEITAIIQSVFNGIKHHPTNPPIQEDIRTALNSIKSMYFLSLHLSDKNSLLNSSIQPPLDNVNLAHVQNSINNIQKEI
jgi:uncharacterized protein YjbI with pentapeptide repeats